MGEVVFFGTFVACVALGAWIGRWSLAAAALAVWCAAVAITAAFGVFEATSENNALGRFVFIALPGLAWVLAVAVGVLLARATSRESRPEPPRARRA